jgi:sialate O-acetylesterase
MGIFKWRGRFVQSVEGFKLPILYLGKARIGHPAFAGLVLKHAFRLLLRRPKPFFEFMTVTKRLRNSCLLAAMLVLTCFAQPALSEVRLPNVFGNHMVLQRDKTLTIWGWAQPGENISVQISSARVQVQANERGEWTAILPAMPAGGPYTLKIWGSSTVLFEDVMIGEVWLCSGQSNMELGVGLARGGKEEIAAADFPNIRLLLVGHNAAPLPQTNIDGAWKVCSPQTLGQGGWSGFSAVGYYFGRELEKNLGVAVGLIDSTWGGTRIEPWTPPEGFAAVPAMERESERVQLGDPQSPLHQHRLEQTLDDTEKWLAAARLALAQRALVPPMPVYPAELQAPRDQQSPTALYNGMIHPLRPFALRGAIWYQGESNLGDGMSYRDKMEALVRGWRKVWNEGDFPFYFVQIAPFNYGGNPHSEPELWEAQSAAQLVIPNSGMAVINDLGELADIHPKNKSDVGKRLALWALANTYGQSNLVFTGPVFKSFSIEGDKLRLNFDHAGSGLTNRDSKPLSWFEIIDADDGGFVKADARMDGTTIVLSSPEVKHPVAMRFAWDMMAEPNLMNVEGFPVGAFRAGEVPNRDLLLIKVPEAKDYRLVYDLNLAKLGENIRYDKDNSDAIRQSFDRIAYFMELQHADGSTEYLYVSMNAFTTDLKKIGVPTVKSGAYFQQNVTNMDIYSNVKSVVAGLGLSGGNIEFWPNNYAQKNSANVPNASSDLFDFGDQPTDPADGYGSMQVHNHNAKQTLFSLNHWREGNGADIGIGNQPTANPDWTFAGNAASYPVRRLRIFVRCK